MQIELTDSEIEVVMKSLEHFASAPHSVREGVCIDEINELSDDIREQDARRDDGWGDAETEMFNAGVEARERMKERNRLMSALESQGGRNIELAEQIDQLDAEMKPTSRAAGRRALNFCVRHDDDDRSETQKHDVFDHEWNPDDPKNW